MVLLLRIKRFISLWLCFHLALSPGLSYGGQSLVPDERILEQISEPTEGELESAKEFLRLPTQYIFEINYLLKKLYERVDQATESAGLERLAEKLALRKDSEAISFEKEGIGKAELIVIGKGENARFLTKVRHNGLKATILFVDREQLDLEAIEEKPDSTLTEKQYQQERELRRYLATQWRTLLARVILSEWNPEFTYKPLVNEKGEFEAPESLDTDVEEKIRELERLTARELSEKSWYQKLKNKWYDLAIAGEKIPGSEAFKETMVVFYDSQKSRVLAAKSYQPYEYKNESYFSKKRYVKFLDHVVTWWRSIYEPPAYDRELWKNSKGLGKLRVLLTGDYLMGIGSGFVLASLSYGVGLLVPSSLPEGLTAFNVAQISFIWTIFFGVFSRTWQNFVYRGSEFSRFCKNWITGLGQSYHFNLISDENLWVLRDGEFDSRAAKIHSDILINQTIKNYSKTALQELPRFRSITGEASGTVKIRYYRIVLPSRHNPAFLSMETGTEDVQAKTAKRKLWGFLEPAEHDTLIPRRNLEGQLVQLVSTPVSLLSRFGWTVMGMPLGHLLYLALGPIGEYAAIRYKAKYAKDLAAKLGPRHPLVVRMKNLAAEEYENWRKLRIFNLPYTSPIGFYTKVIPASVWRTSQQFARWGITRLANISYRVIYGELKTERSPVPKPRGLGDEAPQRPSARLRCQAIFSSK